MPPAASLAPWLRPDCCDKPSAFEASGSGASSLAVAAPPPAAEPDPGQAAAREDEDSVGGLLSHQVELGARHRRPTALCQRGGPVGADPCYQCGMLLPVRAFGRGGAVAQVAALGERPAAAATSNRPTILPDHNGRTVFEQ